MKVAPRGQSGRRAQRVARHPAGLESASENLDQACQFPFRRFPQIPQPRLARRQQSFQPVRRLPAWQSGPASFVDRVHPPVNLRAPLPLLRIRQAQLDEFAQRLLLQGRIRQAAHRVHSGGDGSRFCRIQERLDLFPHLRPLRLGEIEAQLRIQLQPANLGRGALPVLVLKCGRHVFGLLQVLEDLPQRRELVLSAGSHHHRRQVAHHHRRAAPPRRGRFAAAVHDVVIRIRHIAQDRLRAVPAGLPDVLARQKLQRAVPSEVHHRVRLELVAIPEIGRDVGVRRRDIGVVERLHVALEGGAQRLRSQEHVAHAHAGYDEKLLPIARRDGHQLRLLWRTPARVHEIPKLLGQRLEPQPVFLHRNQHHVALLHQRFQLTGSPYLDIPAADFQ